MGEKINDKLICSCSICDNAEFCKFKEEMESYMLSLNAADIYPKFLYPSIINCIYSDTKQEDRARVIKERSRKD